MLHQESQSILQTILAYWDARSAADQVEVGRRSVKLQADLLNLTQELIKAGEMPAADEARNQASYADALARLDAAERRLHESRINLARAIGMSLPAASAGPMPADAFPPPVQVAAPDEAVLALVRTAFDRRNDLLAAQTILEAAGILVKGAKDDTRRLLNVDGSFWGTGLGEDEISNVDRWVFKSGEARATFEMPFKNNQAMGRYGQRQASERQAAIDAGDQARTIGLNVERLSRSLALAAERLQRARESVVAYDKTIESEQAKLKAGDSTLIDTILTEQQTTAARLTLVSAEQEYATTLARLLFETGLILDRQEGIAKVNGDALVGVPAQLQGARQ
jgi:outer membrane protein TolC